MTDAAPATAVETPAAAPAPTGQNAPSGQETPRTPTGAVNAPGGEIEIKVPDAKPEMFDVKVNGKMVRMTKDDLIKKAALADGAFERFEQAAAKERQVNAILAKAKSNPIGSLMEAGLTKDEAREAFEAWYSSEYIEPETLTKEQRDLKAAQDELKRYKEQEKAWRERKQAEQEEAEVNTHRELLQKQIIDAMEEHGMPKGAKKFAMSRIAFYMKQARDKGFDAPMDLIVQQVKQERDYLIQDIPEDANYQTLVDLYGETVVKRIISEHLKHIRTLRGKAAPAVSEVKPTETTTKLSMREAEQNLRKLMGR